mgnify:FL=1
MAKTPNPIKNQILEESYHLRGNIRHNIDLRMRGGRIQEYLELVERRPNFMRDQKGATGRIFTLQEEEADPSVI